MSEPAKLWRAKLHTQELIDCGFDPRSADEGWSVITGILKAKGLPDWCVQDRTPFKSTMVKDGILLEFGG